MKFSFGSWALSFGPYSRSPVLLPAIAERVAKAGYDGIEISGFAPHISLDAYPTVESRRHVTGMLTGLGLAVSGYVADLSLVNPLVEGNRSRYLDLFRRNLEMSVDIGSPRIRVDTVAAPGSIADSEYAPAMDRLASLWHDASEIAGEAGVRVAWEFEPGFIFNKPSEIVDLYEQVGHSNFQILFDTCHGYVCGVVGARQHGTVETLPSIEEFLTRLSGRIGHIHIIDADGTLYGDETSTHRPFGQGVIDFKRLIPKLKSVPGIDWWCVDLAFWPGSWELVEPSLKTLKKMHG